MIISIFREDQHILSTRKARRYSTTWILSSQLEDSPEPVVLGTAANRFPTSTTPLEATTRPGSLIIGAITLSRAPGSRIESASTTQTYASDARSKPQFSAPALLPPAHLSITRRRLSERLRQRLLTGWQETVRLRM